MFYRLLYVCLVGWSACLSVCLVEPSKLSALFADSEGPTTTTTTTTATTTATPTTMTIPTTAAAAAVAAAAAATATNATAISRNAQPFMPYYMERNPCDTDTNRSAMSSPSFGGHHMPSLSSPSSATMLDFSDQTADAITILVSPDHFHDHDDDDDEDDDDVDGNDDNMLHHCDGRDADDGCDRGDDNNNDDRNYAYGPNPRRRHADGFRANDFSIEHTMRYQNDHKIYGEEFSSFALHNRSHNLHNYHHPYRHRGHQTNQSQLHQSMVMMPTTHPEHNDSASAQPMLRQRSSAIDAGNNGTASAVPPASSASAANGKVCPVCHKTFSRAWSLQRHMTDRHFYVPQHLECDICGRTYRSRNSLISHKSQYHGAGVSSKVVAAAAAAAAAAASATTAATAPPHHNDSVHY